MAERATARLLVEHYTAKVVPSSAIRRGRQGVVVACPPMCGRREFIDQQVEPKWIDAHAIMRYIGAEPESDEPVARTRSVAMCNLVLQVCKEQGVCVLTSRVADPGVLDAVVLPDECEHRALYELYGARGLSASYWDEHILSTRLSLSRVPVPRVKSFDSLAYI